MSGLACGSYYRKNIRFNRAFEGHNIEKAEEILSDYKNADKKGYRLAYFLDRGVVKHELGAYHESNVFLEKAYFFSEKHKKGVGSHVLSTLLNPNLNIYYGETHEHLLPLYYKALNYVHMGNISAALIECRRLNLRLQEQATEYKSEKKYSQDAFIHTFLGLLYEANGDMNDAFIAYRNAYNAYENIYMPLFGIPTPMQLKRDLLRTAAKIGFRSEQLYYERIMNLKTPPRLESGSGEVIIFWHSGLIPIKTEVDMSLWIVPSTPLQTRPNRRQKKAPISTPGVVYVKGGDFEIALPITLKNKDQNFYANMKTLRLTLPQYENRRPHFDTARLVYASAAPLPFEHVEPLEAIAHKCLRDRIAWELASSLTRLALREGLEAKLRKQNEVLGWFADILGSLTESSDTRGCQTLPANIYYARMALPAGTHRLILQSGRQSDFVKQDTLVMKVRAGQLHFYKHASWSKNR